jgi:hypothetical protein
MFSRRVNFGSLFFMSQSGKNLVGLNRKRERSCCFLKLVLLYIATGLFGYMTLVSFSEGNILWGVANVVLTLFIGCVSLVATVMRGDF